MLQKMCNNRITFAGGAAVASGVHVFMHIRLDTFLHKTAVDQYLGLSPQQEV